MIVLGIGSSIEPKEYYLRKAIYELSKILIVKKISKIYKTKAWGGVAQNEFLNICVAVDFSGEPEELLNITQEIENKLGRLRLKHWGDRTIDIDILLFKNMEINTERLIIPHPYITKRNFVLKPLEDICGNLVINNKRIDKWLENINDFIEVYKEKIN